MRLPKSNNVLCTSPDHCTHHHTPPVIDCTRPAEDQSNQRSIMERKASLKDSLLMDVYGVKVDGFWGAIVLYI